MRTQDTESKQMEEKNTNSMANCGRDGVAIDVEALTYSPDTLISGNFVMAPECCIFKTPNILSRHNEKAYAPNAFSIGPWHFGKPHLEATQKIKKKYLQGLINRSEDPERKLRQLEDAIRVVANDARDCYAGPVGTTQDLVKILVLDGCFIIELFRKFVLNKIKNNDKDEDPIFTVACMLEFLYHDLVLLENHIPWFVLQLLFDMTKVNAELPLDLLAITFFEDDVVPPQCSCEEMSELLRHESSKSKHILDLLRNLLILPSKKEETGEGSNLLEESFLFPALPCATSLREAGIKLEKLESKSILDIQFENGVLKIPRLVVQDTTESVFRNLISLEQCAPNYDPKITSYAKLMDQLIENGKDMEILCEKEIIVNWLTLEDASKFFDKLYIDTFVKDFCYDDLCKQVNKYCRRDWPKWRAHLMQKYFNNPWAAVGLVVAGLILALTIIGTICSVLQVK